MMLVELGQKKVATIASPTCGFVGLNPLRMAVPISERVLFCTSSAIGVTGARGGALLANAGAPGPEAAREGPEGSLQAVASSAADKSTGRATTVARLDMIPPPGRVRATPPFWQGSGQALMGRTAQTGMACVDGPPQHSAAVTQRRLEATDVTLPARRLGVDLPLA